MSIIIKINPFTIRPKGSFESPVSDWATLENFKPPDQVNIDLDTESLSKRIRTEHTYGPAEHKFLDILEDELKAINCKLKEMINKIRNLEFLNPETADFEQCTNKIKEIIEILSDRFSCDEMRHVHRYIKVKSNLVDKNNPAICSADCSAHFLNRTIKILQTREIAYNINVLPCDFWENITSALGCLPEAHRHTREWFPENLFYIFQSKNNSA